MIRLVFSSIMLTLFLSVGSQGELRGQTTTTAKPQPIRLHTEVEQVLKVQSAAWNAGDLDGFMSTYWKSEKLSFSSGGRTTFGWQATLERYQRNYTPPKEMGRLKFSELIVTPIEQNSVLVLGNWHLTVSDSSNPHGNFSLVVKKIDGNWKIIHDHTSSMPANTNPNSNPSTRSKRSASKASGIGNEVESE